LAFSFLPDYRLDLSVRSLLGSRSRLQDVPKIAQLVEAQIHSWLNNRCVEPRYQQIILPNLWPRKKNTRGGEDEEEGISDNSAVEDKDSDQENATVDAEKGREEQFPSPPIGKRDSLEAKMAEEGRKLLAAEGRQLHPQDTSSDGPRKRPTLSKKNSAEEFRIPGRFQ
jgi:maintenance of mitochondrial morphology protein 1